HKRTNVSHVESCATPSGSSATAPPQNRRIRQTGPLVQPRDRGRYSITHPIAGPRPHRTARWQRPSVRTSRLAGPSEVPQTHRPYGREAQLRACRNLLPGPSVPAGRGADLQCLKFDHRGSGGNTSGTRWTARIIDLNTSPRALVIRLTSTNIFPSK